ncbi:MAG: DUF1015 domain-containing protein [Vallitaleaceae bacterium]|nr:DUF1015 domain-containing protein [Vallitaleaceae bacterium]
MAVIQAFKALRPAADFVSKIAALPYDVYNRAEAKEEVRKNPLSFLQIDRGETLLDDQVSMYAPVVYETAKAKLEEMIQEGKFVFDCEEGYYLYELERQGRVQRGLVGCVLAKEYEAGIIRKHENTREVKEQDRIAHIDVLQAHTGPIFLTYPNDLKDLHFLDELVLRSEVIFEFIGEDGVRHKGYRILAQDQGAVSGMIAKKETLYIADGHHRAASAAKIAKKYQYEGEAAAFLAVCFPADELEIMDYNRVVTDLNGLSADEFLKALQADFTIVSQQKDSFKPMKKATFGMYLDNQWYGLEFKRTQEVKEDPVKNLDVSILQDFLLRPILGIDDPRTSERIDFVGGIRGLQELERRVHEDMAVAFAMKATTIQELMAVSDLHQLMPPKSTWFEPKLKSGLFIHSIK